MKRGAQGKKSEFGKSPAKGTRLRELLKRTLSKQGFVASTQHKELGYKNRNIVSGDMEKLKSEKGWDIRTFSTPNPSGKGKAIATHRAVGKLLPGGKYRSFVKNIKEDAVASNCAGSGAITGIGTGTYPNSEPGVPKGKKRLRVILNKAKMLTRK